MFKDQNKEYLEEIPDGVDPRYGCHNWFNFWYEDYSSAKFAIGNDRDFQQCLQVYAIKDSVKISAVDNTAVLGEFMKQS